MWPETDPVTFNFRMPGDHQRVMLFENLLYMNESSLKKREKDITRRTNEHIVSNKDALLFDKIIQTIKTLYPVKIKGTHKNFSIQDAKMMQVMFKRNLGKATILEMPSSKQQPKQGNQTSKNQTNFKRRQSHESIKLNFENQSTSFVEQKVNQKFLQSNIYTNRPNQLSNNSQFSTPN